MLRLALLLLLSVPTLAGEAEFERAVEKIDRQIAGRLRKIGKAALRANQGATANRIFRRVLQLKNDDRGALKELGYKKEKGEWDRSRMEESRINTRRDRDPLQVVDIRRAVRKEEIRRARAIVAAAQEEEVLESARPDLLALLDKTPRLRDVHEALGHRRVGASYVRPEFTRMVKHLRAELRAWKECRVTDLEAQPAGETLDVNGRWPAYRVGARIVAATYPMDEAQKAALWTEAPHVLVRTLFGEYSEGWEPRRVYFLTPGRYEMLIRRHETDPHVVKRRLRWRNYYHTRFTAMRADDGPNAADVYAHSVGFMTMDRWASPDVKKSVGPKGEYSWLNEGFGYFLTLELFDSANTQFATDDETAAKRDDAITVPGTKTKATCLAYVREHLLHGVHYPLREVFGRTLNNLDFLASMEAWTFLRFLLLYDAEGFRRLMDELRRQVDGPLPDRADRALREAFDKSTAELEYLWRAFTLEIE